MEKLKKGKAIVYPPRIASGAHVYAYELATAAVDKTYVGGPGRPFTPLQTAHQNAAYNVAICHQESASGAHVYAYELATAAVDKTYVGGPDNRLKTIYYGKEDC